MESADEPIVLKVVEGRDQDVGQVVIPLVSIKSRPTDQLRKPTSPSRMLAEDLEPTKKVSNATGKLFFWIWAEEFYEDGESAKQSRGSVLSSSHLHRSASKLSGLGLHYEHR